MGFNRTYFFLAILTFLAGAGFIFAQEQPAFIFLNDLREGDSGRDVLELQKVLKTDETVSVSPTVSSSRAISTRSQAETGIFDSTTKERVIRFQNKYADEVLRPAGVETATGFVGLWTRLKLNQILLKSSTAQLSTPSQTQSQMQTRAQALQQTKTQAQSAQIPSQFSSQYNLQAIGLGSGTGSGLFPTNSDELYVFSPSTYSAPSGTRITLRGGGFSLTSNTVKLNDEKITVAAQSTNELSFTIPASLPVGRYDITVTVGKKTSNPTPFMVTVPNAIPPKVISIEPKVAVFGKSVKITGENFTRKGNIITTGLGVIRDLESKDGKTIEVTFPLPDYLESRHPQLLKIWFGEDKKPWPMSMRVSNVNGLSDINELSKFEIGL